jgi:uncharacterized protein GlcG (DUF336 family)
MVSVRCSTIPPIFSELNRNSGGFVNRRMQRTRSRSYNIAITDACGGLVAHVRMDSAWLGSVEIAINKAWTARAFDTWTDDFARLTQPGQQGFGLKTTNDSGVAIFGGGIPIKLDGVIVGSVGASGGSVEPYVAVARAAVSGFTGR